MQEGQSEFVSVNAHQLFYAEVRKEADIVCFEQRKRSGVWDDGGVQGRQVTGPGWLQLHKF